MMSEAGKSHVLIVDDQSAIREELAYALRYEGHEATEAADGVAGLAEVEKGGIDAVLLDIKMPGMDGLEVLSKLRESHPEIPVIMITGHGDIETAVVAIKSGAYDFLPKPFDTDRVLVSLTNGLRMRDLATENTALKEALNQSHRLIGKSAALEEVRRTIARVAPTEAQVLITGENGTGKELVAHQLHALSKRNRGPLVALNCAAIPTDLLESELFGHEKGAFTGADKVRHGHFEAAHGGTLLLDEIGDMALDAQAKLLRALQEQTITRVGGSQTIPVDVRVLAATNQDLQALVDEKAFREDLYYRLHVIRIHVPPLRERLDDIDELGPHFVREACRRNGLPRRTLAKDAFAQLRGLPWRGNVRELKNLLEAAAIMAEGEQIQAADLHDIDVANTPSAAGVDMFEHETLGQFKAASEREFIRRKIAENSGNIKRTAERIQIQRSNLYKKLDRYGLK
ncbi:MAG: sigma-54 dependent transcriptional regulator [Planctomycetota bacterium]|nr:sigma-54 dependent transcriptional regulator [Planctomycetota bacterium]